MSRILRRPMFRGGRVDSRGMGITSGLDRTGYSSGGSTGLSPSTTTGSQILNQALGQPGTLIGDTNRLLGNLRQGIFNTITRPLGNIPIAASNYAFGTNLDYIQPMDYQQDILNLMENVRVGKTAKSKVGSAQANENDANESFPQEDGITNYDYSPSETIEQQERIAELKTPETKPSTNIEDIDKDEVSLSDVEKAKKEYAELLGIEKARGRDISDMLGRFSAAALRAPSLRDAFADYMALEAKAGPGRAEKIQEAAGTLAAKEKISENNLIKDCKLH